MVGGDRVEDNVERVGARLHTLRVGRHDEAENIQGVPDFFPLPKTVIFITANWARIME